MIISAIANVDSVCLTTDSTDIFPVILNWKCGEIKTYDPENLYIPIDGAADMFLRYNFEEMMATEYTRDSNYINVEVYKHKTLIDAFGVYSQERPENNIYFDIGVQGYKESDYLNFLAGCYYIKMRVWKVNENSHVAMNEIATELAEKLNNNASFPDIFSVFPGEGRIPFSEKYISQDVLGYSFLHSSFQVDYNINGNAFTIFALIGKDEQDAISMLEEYLIYLKQPANDTSDRLYHVVDKYNGPITILKSGKNLLCVRGNISVEESKRLLNELEIKLTN